MFHKDILLLEAFHANHNPRNFRSALVSTAGGTPPQQHVAHLMTRIGNGKTLLEVEQKFSLIGQDIHDIEDRLVNAGFIQESKFEMTDWYFDTKSPSYSLTLQDCWLRYRESPSSGGCWQLKRGSSSSSLGQSQRKATVYEETEGVEAITLASSLVTDVMYADASNQRVFEGHWIPELPPGTDAPFFEPFARIVTHRTHWCASNRDDPTNPFALLAVDLDCTDFGHAVGEVELVVESDDEVPRARALIQQFLRHVIHPAESGESEKAAQGKLECYFERYRPDLYRALIDAGVMK